jgi:hypothetical protein
MLSKNSNSNNIQHDREGEMHPRCMMAERVSLFFLGFLHDERQDDGESE